MSVAPLVVSVAHGVSGAIVDTDGFNECAGPATPGAGAVTLWGCARWLSVCHMSGAIVDTGWDDECAGLATPGAGAVTLWGCV